MPTSAMEHLTDRELLIQQLINMRTVSDNVKELKRTNIKDHADIFKQIHYITERKTSNKLFFWVMGILVATQVMLASAVGVMSLDITNNASDIEHIEQKLNRMNK